MYQIFAASAKKSENGTNWKHTKRQMNKEHERHLGIKKRKLWYLQSIMCIIGNSYIQKRTVIKENNICLLSCIEPSFKTFCVYMILTEIYRML